MKSGPAEFDLIIVESRGVMMRSRVFPASCVGYELCIIRLPDDIISVNNLEWTDVILMGILKSPRIIVDGDKFEVNEANSSRKRSLGKVGGL